MASEDAPTGIMLSAGAGVYALAQIIQGPGVALTGDDANPDKIAEHWSEISDMSKAKALFTGGEHSAEIFKKLTS